MGILVSSSYIENAASVITGYPFTMACAVINTGGVGTGMCMSIGSNTTRNAASIGNISGNWALNADNGTAFQTTVSTVQNPGPPWVFILGRFISATNRWLTVVSAGESTTSGMFDNAQGTTNVTLSGFTRIRIGARADNTSQPWAGSIAEAWYTNADIQADGAATEQELAFRLAYQGPTSVPHIMPMLVEWKRLRRSNGDSSKIVYDDQYWNAGLAASTSPPVWTPSGTVTLTHHPKQSDQYRRRDPHFGVLASPTQSVFRRTLAQMGTGVGSRHVHGFA